jgi:hypothetical protein
MPINNRAKRRLLFSNLLKLIRPELKDCPPIYFLRISGFASEEESKNLVAAIVCAMFDPPYMSLNLSHTYDTDCTIFSGGPAWFDAGIERIKSLSPQILEAYKTLVENDSAEELKDVPKGREWMMVGLLTEIFTEWIRSKAPESLAIPPTVQGKPRLDPQNQIHIWFPGDRVLSFHQVVNMQIWNPLVEAVKAERLFIYAIKVPILHCVALIARYVLDNQQSPRVTLPSKKPKKWFSSGHKETDGEWSGPLPLSIIARCLKQTEEGAKKLLADTGLIQKTRQNWIVRIDNLKVDWADAVNAAKPRRRPKKPS